MAVSALTAMCLAVTEDLTVQNSQFSQLSFNTRTRSQTEKRTMKEQKVFGCASMTSGSFKNDRRAGRGLDNPAGVFAAIAAACIWFCRPCEGQIEVSAYIANGGSNDVTVINTTTNMVVGSPIGVGSGPVAVAVTPDGKYVYVTNNGSNTISVIDAATNTVVGPPINLVSQAAGIAVTPDGKYAYVTNTNIQGFTGNTVSVINTATNTVLGLPITVGSGALGIAITPDGKYAYVANNHDDTVSVINTATNTVVGSPIAVGNSPVGVAVTPNGNYVFVTNNSDNTVSVISTATHSVVGPPIGVGNEPAGVVITPDGRFAYVANDGSGNMPGNTVSVIDIATDTVVGLVTVGSQPLGIDITPDGKYVYVTNSKDGTVSVINTATNTVLGPPIAVGSFPISLGFFVGPNIIVAQGGPLRVANDAALTPLGFGQFVDFNGGTLKTTGDLVTSRTISLLLLGGTIDSNGFDVIFSGDIINSGSLTKMGAGTLTLSGNNAYTGGTNIVGGVLSVSSDSNLGTGGITISNNAELLTTGALFASTKAITLGTGGGTVASATGTTAAYGSVISGSGRLSVGDAINDGMIVLSAANTYSGGTVLNFGTLVVNNAQALGLGDVVVAGGVLRADPQPINVKGNYTQYAGGTLQLQVAGADPGQYDRLNVGGNAALGGTLQLISLGFQPKAGNQLTLISTGGVVSGRFAQLLDPFPTGPGSPTAELVYGPNSVLLEFLNSVINFASFALTPNQLAAANLLDAVQLDPRAANLISFLDKEPFVNLPGDFEKISPDALTSFYEITFSNANIQRLNIEGRLDDLRAGSTGFSSNMNVNSPPLSPEGKGGIEGKSAKSPVEQALQPTPENRWGIWVTGFGDFVNVDGDYNAHGYDFTTGGFTVGVDYRITDQFAIGAMGEYAHTWTSLRPVGDIDVHQGYGELYATYFYPNFYINGAVIGAYNSFNTRLAGLC
jgi:outer membrane autotransporter protein